MGHTRLFIFKLHMTRIFWGFNFYLTCKFGQTCKYYKICILHNKISFWRDQISNFSSVYGFVFHSSGYFFEKILIQCKAKKCYFSDVIIRKKKLWCKNLCMLNNELPGISKNSVCLIFYLFGFKLRKFIINVSISSDIKSLVSLYQMDDLDMKRLANFINCKHEHRQ